jgi:Mrp family chromosome partitioning ATPase
MGLIPVREAKKIYLYRDAIEHLLNRVYFGRGHHKHRTGVVVLVTSALPNEGKTTTSKALAEAAVARGLRVLLVDGDLRSFDQIESGSVGLAEVLRGEVAAAEAIRSESSLAVLSSGRSRENPIRLLSLPMAESIFQTVAMNYDLVVVDGPPVLVGGDCWMLSRHVDKTLMVVKWSSTSPTAISAALKQLNTPIDDPNLPKSAACSIVLNMVEKSRRIEDTAMMFEASNYYQQKAR